MSPPLRLVSGSGGSSVVRDAGVEASASGAGPADPIGRTTRPMVTGSSVIAIRCVDGVVRLHVVSGDCVVGIGGDLSDQDEILTMLGNLTNDQYCLNDGYVLGPRAMYSYLSRVMYNRRNKMDPLWNSVVFGGVDADGSPMLGLVDLHGAHFESEVIATGYGLHMGLPLLRKAWRPDLTVAEAIPVVEDIMKVLFYRDARTSDRIQTAIVQAAGSAAVAPPKVLDSKWNHKAFISGARVCDVSTW
jgi:20S proteasome subunit beta 7